MHIYDTKPGPPWDDPTGAARKSASALDLPTGTPVLVIKGGTRDDEGRALHYIEVTGAGGRVAFEDRY